MKKLLYALFATAMLVLTATGCNTMRGAGQDIENAAEEVDEAL